MKQQVKALFSVLAILLIGTHAIGQAGSLKSQVDSLVYASGDAFDCDAVTWKIIAHKKDAIQMLINKLDDETVTAAKDKCKTANLRVGDIAYLALTKILQLPFFAVTGMQCDVFENGCQLGIFEYLEHNRIKFKAQVQVYYDSKKDRLTWRRLDSNHLTPCYLRNKINGLYE